MLTTCLINNCNYRPYVAEAVESALGQTQPFDQILVIDDGSTDGSRQLLAEQFDSVARVQIIRKQNGGQLSAFNHAIPHVTGDLVFFLDADDRYRSTYLERALATRGRPPILSSPVSRILARVRQSRNRRCRIAI